jgi:hypothetical protein
MRLANRRSLSFLVCADSNTHAHHSEHLGGHHVGNPIRWRGQRRLPRARQLQPAVRVPHT